MASLNSRREPSLQLLRHCPACMVFVAARSCQIVLLHSFGTLLHVLNKQVRFWRGLPLILLHFACAVATAPRVCRTSAYAAMPLRLCSAAAWALQVGFALQPIDTKVNLA